MTQPINDNVKIKTGKLLLSRRRPSIDRLHELLRYDTETGEMFWKVKRSGKAVAGSRVGSNHGAGYIEARVDGCRMLLHIIVFAFIHGRYPKKWIDHIDRNKKNNRVENLREIDPSGSTRNSVRESRTGFRGVYIKPTKFGINYHSQLMVNGKRLFVGAFSTAKEAAEAYDRAVLAHFGPSYPTNKSLGAL